MSRVRFCSSGVGSPVVLALTTRLQAYAWGAVDGMAELAGTEPTGGPEAELWAGAHPKAPSLLDDGRGLDEVVAEGPERLLGRHVVDRFGPRLPFLLKLLCIARNLSIQLHPTAAQAQEGFAREEAAGIELDAPSRTYRDPFAKPEVLVALRPTWILAGFRRRADVVSDLRRLGDPVLDPLTERMAGAPDGRDALAHLLGVSGPERSALAAAAARADDCSDTAVIGWIRRLAAAYPHDPTALAPLLLELRRVSPGEGVLLPAGVPHAYLHGAGVELMGASDNVVRGGLTAKHVDPAELARLLAPPGVAMVALPGRDVAEGTRLYDPGEAEIALHRIEPDGSAVTAPSGHGPALALAVGGAPEVTTASGRTEVLGRGRAVLVSASERSACRISGTGSVWWATTGDELGPPSGS